MKNLFSILVISLLAATYVNAAEMDHGQKHGEQHHPSMTPDKPAMGNKHHDMEHDMSQSMEHQGMRDKDSGHSVIHGEAEQHSGHSMESYKTPAQSSSALKPLTKVPPSGKAREAGFDGTYTMEDTSVDHSLARRCALASRGLVMLDKASWSQCGNKSKETPDKMPASTPSGMHDQHLM